MWYCKLVLATAIFSIAGIGVLQDVGQIFAPQWGIDSIIRWTITLGSLGLATYLTWANRTDAAKAKTIAVQKEELQILDTQNKRFREELILKDKEILILEGNIKALTARTDISQVLDRQQQLLLMKQEHDAAMMTTQQAMVEAIKMIGTTGAAQFAEAMKVISAMAAQMNAIHAVVVKPT